MARPPKDSNKNTDKVLKYGPKADKYNDDKYAGDTTTGQKAEGDKPPA